MSDTSGKVKGRTFQVWTYNLLGNDKDGYEVNDRYKHETVFIPDTILEGTNLTLCEYLAEKDVISLTKNLRVEDIEIEGESSYTLYFSYKGKPNFELESLGETME